MKTRPLLALFFSAAVALGGCTAPWVQQGDSADRAALPDRYQAAFSPLLIYSDFPLPAADVLLHELTAQRRELADRLGLPTSGQPVQVYLFASAERLRAYVRARHPDFPDRRAFFVESDRGLAVYAQWGDCMAEDLRHELTHAYLHSVVPNLPLWLDEGLAKYFELPSGRHGLNPQYVRQIVAAIARGEWHPDLRRLELLDPAADMTQKDYVEAWAWVHFLLESQPPCKDLLCQYLAELRGHGRITPLSARLTALAGHPEWEVSEHVRQLAAVVPQETAGGVRK